MLLEQFIRFTTDIVGVERVLRFVQASLQVLASYPVLLGLVVSVASVSRGHGSSGSSGVAEKGDAAVEMQHLLLGISGQVNMVRRVVRIFRFIESFYVAHQLFSALLWPSERPPPGIQSETAEGAHVRGQEKKGSISPPLPLRLALWLDAIGRGFLAMYQFLDFLALPSSLLVDGRCLVTWPAPAAQAMFLESQRFWMYALVCGVAGNVLRLSRLTTEVPMPVLAPAERATKEKTETAESQEHETSPLVDFLDYDDAEKKQTALRRECERLRRVIRTRSIRLRTWRRALATRGLQLARHTLSDGLDTLLPGVALGWVAAEPGTVGAVMLVTTVLSGWDAWVRCGVEVAEEGRRGGK